MLTRYKVSLKTRKSIYSLSQRTSAGERFVYKRSDDGGLLYTAGSDRLAVPRKLEELQDIGQEKGAANTLKENENDMGTLFIKSILRVRELPSKPTTIYERMIQSTSGKCHKDIFK